MLTQLPGPPALKGRPGGTPQGTTHPPGGGRFLGAHLENGKTLF